MWKCRWKRVRTRLLFPVHSWTHSVFLIHQSPCRRTWNSGAASPAPTRREGYTCEALSMCSRLCLRSSSPKCFFSLVCEFWWDIIPISVCIAQHHIKSFLTMNVKASTTLTDLSYCVSIQREISQEHKFSKTNVTVKDRKRWVNLCLWLIFTTDEREDHHDLLDLNA